MGGSLCRAMHASLAAGREGHPTRELCYLVAWTYIIKTKSIGDTISREATRLMQYIQAQAVQS
jgi:hypothetical protein